MSELKPIAYAIYGIGGGKLYLKDVKPIPADDVTEEWRGDDDFLGDYWAGNKPLFLGRTQPEATKPAQDLSAAIPDGWQLVPKEPTPEMLDKAGHDLYWQAESCEYPQTVLEFQADAHTAWRAMLLAAPACAMTQTRIVMLLREARATLEMWKDVAPAVSLCADIDAALASPADALVAWDRVDVERTGTLYQAVQRAAGELPEGWTICLEIERDAGTVELIDPEGNRKLIDGNDGYLCQAVNEAINAAIQAQKDGHG